VSLAQARALVDLSRPFTLAAPALGFASGAVTAAGAFPPEPFTTAVVVHAAIGTGAAAILNAASNALNQIFDLRIDRINKPDRPLPAGRLSLSAAGWFSAAAYLAALALAWRVAPGGSRACFWIFAAGAALTVVYSVPPLRTKRFGIWANVTIAAARGLLLKAAGWSAVRSVAAVEPWFIGGIFALFLLGATTTKDFSDMDGDRLDGCRTLPLQYGVRAAAWMIAPSFVVPFLLIGAGALSGLLTGNRALLLALSAGLTAYGVFVCRLMLRHPDELARDRNHVSWTHMYRMMFVAQVGFAAAYLL
jgi:4-hydroxybenzoate polyprenyltransferase